MQVKRRKVAAAWQPNTRHYLGMQFYIAHRVTAVLGMYNYVIATFQQSYPHTLVNNDTEKAADLFYSDCECGLNFQ